ncbi:hypothetical protein QYF36_006811 [Acer negundo]|nr:hypothetical protein QYF36_006811 [Acer negundo]
MRGRDERTASLSVDEEKKQKPNITLHYRSIVNCAALFVFLHSLAAVGGTNCRNPTSSHETSLSFLSSPTSHLSLKLVDAETLCFLIR